MKDNIQKLFFSLMGLVILLSFVPSLSATWDTNLNQNLTYVWKFDDSGRNYINPDYNFTVLSGDFIITNEIGCIDGNCLKSNRTMDSQFTTPTMPSGSSVLGLPNQTLNYFVYTQSTGSNQYHFYITGQSYGGWDSSDAFFCVVGGYASCINFNYNFSNSWTMITIVSRDLSFDLYINGTYNNTYATTGWTDVSNALELSKGGGNSLDGYFDEIAFWKRALNDTEIQYIYTNFYEEILPLVSNATINIYSPINATTYNTTSIDLLWSSENSSSCFYSINNTSLVETTTNETLTLFNGNFNLYITCNNSQNIFVNSSIVSFMVNETVVIPPVVVTGDSIYNVLQSSGGGLSRFIQIISFPLFYFLLLIGIVGGIIAIVYSVILGIMESLKYKK